ncbi:MAG: MerC domain-containing protein [Verrucomicrobiota bacterium]|nr:MerC domain-containing protein [Verrucomicrobiota bacterium]
MVPSTLSTRLRLPKADHIGIAASIMCAIHCALAPFLLLTLPAAGKIWAHPSSHILVALLVVPLAAISIRQGYLVHKKRWILTTAYIGISVVLAGSILPLFSKEMDTSIPVVNESGGNSASTYSVIDDTNLIPGENEALDEMECIDNCCPSLQISETGESFLHIPPAAIVTTLGGIFLIVAHVGNLCSCGHACRAGKCDDC